MVKVVKRNMWFAGTGSKCWILGGSGSKSNTQGIHGGLWVIFKAKTKAKTFAYVIKFQTHLTVDQLTANGSWAL